MAEFGKPAENFGAKWSVSDNYCSLSKNGIVMRAIWSIDEIDGVFVTLLEEGGVNEPFKYGYGLPYLVEFRGGSDLDLAKACSDDVNSNLDVVKKYAVGFLEGALRDFHEFVAFAVERVRTNIEKLPPLPTIKTNKFIRAEWI